MEYTQSRMRYDIVTAGDCIAKFWLMSDAENFINTQHLLKQGWIGTLYIVSISTGQIVKEYLARED